MRLTLNDSMGGGPVEKDFPETTIEQIMIIVAAGNGSLPKWLVVVDSNLEDRGHLIYRDLALELKKVSAVSAFVTDLTAKKFRVYNLEMPDIVYAWFYINSKTPNPASMGALAMIKALAELRPTFITNEVERLKQDIIDNKKSAEEISKTLATAEKVSLTEFKTTGENLVLNVKDERTILEVLDGMKVSEMVPFASAKVYMNNGFLELMRSRELGTNVQIYHKLYLPSNYFSDAWLIMDDIEPNVLRFYVDNTTGNKKEFAVGLWNFNTKKIEISFTLEPNISSRDIFLRIIREAFNINGLTIEKSTSKGFIIIPKTRINIPVFLDLVCTNMTMRQFFHMDENAKTSLDKVYFNVYYHASEREDDYIDFTMAHMVANEGQYGMSSGDPYVFLSVKDARDENVVKAFSRNMSLLMTLYKNNYDAIEKIYQEYIGEQVKEHQFKVVGRKKKNDKNNLDHLKQALPHVFSKAAGVDGGILATTGEMNYGRLCQAGRGQPRVVTLPITDDESAEIKQDYPKWNGTTLEFPKNSGIGFYCTGDNKFPGLVKIPREIDFIGNDKRVIERVQYLPCCFGSNAAALKEVNEYLGLGGKVGPVSTGAVKSKRNFLNADQIGEAPEQVVKLMESCFYKNVKRLGVSFDNPDMLLLAINKALRLNKTDRQLRDELLKPGLLEAGIQDYYKTGVRGARRLVLDDAAYLPVRMFYHVCEVAFKCNLVILEQSELDSEEYVFMRPENTLFYTPPPGRVDWPTIVFWLRTSIANREVVELIVQEEGKTRITSYKAAESLLELRALATTYACVNEPPQYETPPGQLVGQVVDSLGKRRGLVCQLDDIKYTVYTGITYPLPVPIVEAVTCKVSDLQRAGLWDTVTKLLEHKKNVVGVLTPYGEVPASLDISTNMGKVPVSPYFITKPTEIIDTVNKTLVNYKIASYLMQNVLHLYSELNMDFDALGEALVVDDSFEYTLDMFGKSVADTRDSGANSPYIGSSLICSSEALKGRMMNWAEQLYHLAPELVRNFKTQNTYLDYYQYAHDFNRTPLYRVYDSEEAVRTHFRQHNYRVWLKTDVPSIAQKPYYVYNEVDKVLELVR